MPTIKELFDLHGQGVTIHHNGVTFTVKELQDTLAVGTRLIAHVELSDSSGWEVSSTLKHQKELLSALSVLSNVEFDNSKYWQNIAKCAINIAKALTNEP